MVTEMLVDPSTTWLLVRTSPEEVMIIPVPAAAPEPVLVWMTVLMSTIAGSTLAAIACALSVPFWLGDGLTGEIGAVEVGGSLVFGNVALWVACEECREDGADANPASPHRAGRVRRRRVGRRWCDPAFGRRRRRGHVLVLRNQLS